MPNCQRCDVPCVGAKGNPDARMMRLTEKKGVCVNCATVLFLKRLDAMNGGQLLPPGENWVEALRLPHIRDQFAAVMKAGDADVPAAAIDWDRVIEIWNIADDTQDAKKGLF